MSRTYSKITLAHGSGGRITKELIENLFFKYFSNEVLLQADDAARVVTETKQVAFTTDSFVVKPLFFPGGDIGKLAICGTVNDLAVSGAEPKFISCGFIIEEGFEERDLEEIVNSMAFWAKEAGVKIVAGDTKVVEKGKADGLFINTSGIGIFKGDVVLGRDKIRVGDKLIITGQIGDHGMAVLSKRKGIEFESQISSDCAPLNKMLMKVIEVACGRVKFMRDVTRGGLATVLNEITSSANFGMVIEETKIPVGENVRAACELLGIDPIYIANEGTALLVADAACENEILKVLREDKHGAHARTIGEVTTENCGKVCLKTAYGVFRIVDMLSSEPLPRIC